MILLEEIIERNIARLFLSYDVICAHPYRIMRNADLTIDEDEAAGSAEGDPEAAETAAVGRGHPSGNRRHRWRNRLLKILKKEFHVHEPEDLLRSTGRWI